jgi:aminomethyltransferase
VGLFDVSHLGKASVKGAGALDFLNKMFTNDLNRITDGKAQYTLLCNEDGGVVDDLIAYRNSEQDFFLIPNASNTTAVVEVLKAEAPEGVEVINLHNSFAVLALQGPKAVDVIRSFGINPTMDYMAFAHVEIAGAQVILCRTGYTGEHGYEIVPSWEDASRVWDALVDAMKPFDGVICGLGARDTLRTEMGYPLHGHELTLEITPVQASAGWAIGWKKDEFRGSQSLRKQKEEKVLPTLYALKACDRGIPRAGMVIRGGDGSEIGVVTSGTFSPTLKTGIALALINPGIEIGQSVIVDVRGRDSVATIVELPMVESHVR